MPIYLWDIWCVGHHTSHYTCIMFSINWSTLTWNTLPEFKHALTCGGSSNRLWKSLRRGKMAAVVFKTTFGGCSFSPCPSDLSSWPPLPPYVLLESEFGVLYKSRGEKNMVVRYIENILKGNRNCYYHTMMQYCTCAKQNLHIINTQLLHVKVTFLESRFGTYLNWTTLTLERVCLQYYTFCPLILSQNELKNVIIPQYKTKNVQCQ